MSRERRPVHPRRGPEFRAPWEERSSWEAATRAALFGLIVALAVGGACSARAQSESPAGTRAQAMGGAFVAVADDGHTLFWNPGALARLNHQEITSTFGNLYADGLSDNALAYHFPLTSQHALALGWQSGGIEDAGLNFNTNRFSLGYGVRFGKAWGVGGSVRHLRESVDLDAGTVSEWSGWTGDLGLHYRPSPVFGAGAVLRNFPNLDVRHETGRTERLIENNRTWVLGAAVTPIPELTVAADFDDRIHLGAEYVHERLLGVQAGLQRQVREVYGESSDGNTYSLGVSVRYGGFKLDAARIFPPVLPSATRVSLGVEFTLTPSRIRVEKAELENVFASHSRRYAQKPVGRAKLVSKHDEPLQARVSLFVPGYMAGPTEHDVVLRPKETKEIDLNAVFAPEILELDEDRPAQAEVRVTYQARNRERTERARTQFFIYQPGAISWADLRAAAAFVTTQDPVISSFARALAQGYDPAGEGGSLRNLYVALRVFNALGAYGITYVPDPNNPFGQVSESQDAVDQIQYPRQLLAQRTGDCDDTSVLYCSLLENLGVATSFLDGPGHILMLFDTGVHARNALVLSVPEELYVVRGDRVWIPVETTLLGRSFVDAWVEGAQIWRRWKDNPESRLVEVQEAWREYQPALPRFAVPEIVPPAPEAVEPRVSADLDSLKAMQERYLEERFLKPLEQQSSVEDEPGSGEPEGSETGAGAWNFDSAPGGSARILGARPPGAATPNRTGAEEQRRSFRAAAARSIRASRAIGLADEPSQSHRSRPPAENAVDGDRVTERATLGVVADEKRNRKEAGP